jgi:hypothetical protein
MTLARLLLLSSIMSLLLSILLLSIFSDFAHAWIHANPRRLVTHRPSARLSRRSSVSRSRLRLSTLDLEREASDQRSMTSLSSLEPESPDDDDNDEIVLGDDGIYQIENEQQHQAFLEANKDKLVVMKVRVSC